MSIRLVGSSMTVPAGNTPGHLNIPGTRIPPSQPPIAFPPFIKKKKKKIKINISFKTEFLDKCYCIIISCLVLPLWAFLTLLFLPLSSFSSASVSVHYIRPLEWPYILTPFYCFTNTLPHQNSVWIKFSGIKWFPSLVLLSLLQSCNIPVVVKARVQM